MSNDSLSKFFYVPISNQMRTIANENSSKRAVNRTKASPNDSYIGILGELVWVRYRYGENAIANFPILSTKGKVDDPPNLDGEPGIEIKTSKTKVHLNAHLMVREDYAKKRAADFYVQVLIPQTQKHCFEKDAYICGYATHAEVLNAGVVERFSTKIGKKQGYKNHEIPCYRLHEIAKLPIATAS